jgi:hypothetical protein
LRKREESYAKIRDLGINFIPGASRNDLELTPVMMAGDPELLAAAEDEKRGDGGESTCSHGRRLRRSGEPLLTDEECEGPKNNCSLTDDDGECEAARTPAADGRRRRM